MSEKWAYWVKDALCDLNVGGVVGPLIPNLQDRLLIRGMGAEFPSGNQFDHDVRRRSNRVEFHIAGQRIPGEHGYRFFPSFYRHLFDTMKRTPVFDENGNLTPETAFNQLVGTPDPAIGFDDPPELITVKFRQFTTIADIQKTIRFFKEHARFTDRDLLQLQTHFLKYITSCKERRTMEAEAVSFWEYIHADRVEYSERAKSFLDGAPQALVAMSAKETDARTQYNILIQMLFKNPLEEFVADKTLNATTSDAWLDRWKKYLKRKGAQFYVGRLEGLTLNNEKDELVPIVTGSRKSRPVPEIDVEAEFSNSDSGFFVMALPFEQASTLIWEAFLKPDVHLQENRFTGPFRQLIDFDIFTARRTPEGVENDRKRNPRTGRPTNGKDPLRDISGIQYFMPNNYKIGDGHVYYSDAAWGLSSISQYGYFRDQLNITGRYIGQTSFDIGNWYKFDSEGDGNTAWNSTRQGLAQTTWDQALRTIEYRGSLISPEYYHLDQGLTFVIGPRDYPNSENTAAVDTTAAFRGNAVIKILGGEQNAKYTITLWGETDIPKLISSTAKAGTTVKQIRDELVSQINQSYIAHAIGLEEDSEFMISPISSSEIALIKVTGKRNEVIIVLNETRFNLEDLSKGVPGYNVEFGNSNIKIYSKSSPDRRGIGSFSVAAFHAELVGGPRLKIFLRAPMSSKRVSLAEIPLKTLEQAIVLDNANAYMINVPGQWRHRPGTRQGKINYAIDPAVLSDSLLRRWIPAGTYMATFTRLTTMESANESGRHAANAILQTLKDLPAPSPKIKALYSGQGKLFGDLCKVQDPEDCEPSDLELFKQLDEALVREGLPHVLDIFRIFELLESLPDDISMTDALEQIRGLTEGQFASAATLSRSSLNALEGAIRTQIDAMRMILAGSIFG